MWDYDVLHVMHHVSIWYIQVFPCTPLYWCRLPYLTHKTPLCLLFSHTTFQGSLCIVWDFLLLWFILLLEKPAQLGLGCLQLCNNEKSVFLVTIIVLYNNWQFKQHIIRYSQFIVRYFLGRFFIEVWFYLFIFDYTSVLICVCAVVYPCYLNRCGVYRNFSSYMVTL